MAEHAHTISRRPLPPLELFDLETHPDGLLIRLCACLGRMHTALAELEHAIERTPAVTLDGRRMKELTL